MEVPIVLIFVGIILAVLVNYLLGILCIVIGLVLVLAPYLQRPPR